MRLVHKVIPRTRGRRAERDGLGLVLRYSFVRVVAGRCLRWGAGWLHLAAGAATECAALCDDGAGESGWHGAGQCRAAAGDAERPTHHHGGLAAGGGEAPRDCGP